MNHANAKIGNNSEYYTNRVDMDRDVSLLKIDVKYLRVDLSNYASGESCEILVSISFDLVDPFASNAVLEEVRRRYNRNRR